MIKFSKRKKLDTTPKKPQTKKNARPRSFFKQGADSFLTEREKIFKEMKNLSKQGTDAYISMNEKRFKHILLSKEYVDSRYIALQIYLLQETIDTFNYEEINKSLESFVVFIEQTLLQGRSISFGDVFYLSGAYKESSLVNKSKIPRVVVMRNKPKGIVFQLRDIEVNLSGTHEFALHELIIRHFNKVFINLLQTKGQVLLGNILVMQLGTDFSVIVSERFLVGGHKQIDIDNLVLATQDQVQNLKTADAKPIAKTKYSHIRYKTEQIFLSRKVRRFSIKSRRFNVKIFDKLEAINKEKTPKGKLTKIKNPLKVVTQSPNAQKYQDKLTSKQDMFGKNQIVQSSETKSNKNAGKKLEINKALLKDEIRHTNTLIGRLKLRKKTKEQAKKEPSKQTKKRAIAMKEKE